MAEYGATLIDPSGNVWSTPQTTPMSLVQKIDINPTAPGSLTLPVNAGSPFLIACHGGANSTIFWISKSGTTYTLNYAVAQGAGSIGNVTVYVFGYVIPQPLPPSRYGIAIWNEQQQCILTNETKVMGTPTGYGTVGSTTDIGYLVDVTIAGKWAVLPRVMGIISGIINSGGLPRPFQSPIDTSAYYNGSTTRISAGTRLNPTGITNPGFSNSRDQIFAIDVSRF